MVVGKTQQRLLKTLTETCPATSLVNQPFHWKQPPSSLLEYFLALHCLVGKGRLDPARPSHWQTGTSLASALRSVPHLQTSASYAFFGKCKEQYSSPDGLGVLTTPGGGEGELSTAAHSWHSPALLGELLLLILLLWETLRQLLRMAQPQVLGRVVMLERMSHVSRHCLRGTSDSLLKMAKSDHFQMFHSPDYLPQNLRTQKLGLLERNKQDLFNLFLVVYSLSRSLKMFHSWGVLEMELDIS